MSHRSTSAVPFVCVKNGGKSQMAAGLMPRPVAAQLLRDVDIVVTLGREAPVEPVCGTRFMNWDTDEPSERGIDGIERMRLIRDDLESRVRRLLDELGISAID